jgi:hypothetical protein
LLFLYDLPNPVLCIVITGFTVAVSLAGYFLFHRVVRFSISDDERALALTVLPIVATIQALLLAFSAVSAWESYLTAEQSVTEEANIVTGLARDLAVFDSQESIQARVVLKAYAQSVVDEEWPLLQGGAETEPAWDRFDAFVRALGAMSPDTPKRAALMPQIWSQADKIVTFRRARIFESQTAIPGTLWLVVMAGTIVTILLTFVLPPNRFNVAMIGALAFAIGLVFFFVIAMDRPYAGSQSLAPAPFTDAIQNIDRWDRSGAGSR